jgi:argininosuccinate lyase
MLYDFVMRKYSEPEKNTNIDRIRRGRVLSFIQIVNICSPSDYDRIGLSLEETRILKTELERVSEDLGTWFVEKLMERNQVIGYM